MRADDALTAQSGRLELLRHQMAEVYGQHAKHQESVDNERKKTKKELETTEVRSQALCQSLLRGLNCSSFSLYTCVTCAKQFNISHFLALKKSTHYKTVEKSW